jgi:hypothetical protein
VFPAEVNVSINGVLPIAFAQKSLKMMPIARCLGDAKPYKEGAGTFSLAGSPAASSSAAASGSHSGTATAGGSTSTASAGTSTSSGGPKIIGNSAVSLIAGTSGASALMVGSAVVFAVLPAIL